MGKMGLREKQSEFTLAVGKLILRAFELGYELTYGDTYPSKKHRAGSFHDKGLAVDFNLFRDGKYLTKTEDHEPLGLYWESLGGTWGGRFTNRDGNHYSWGER
jgi:hypothetical protein